MPNRIIKESICTSDTINQLTEAQEVFFYRLMVQCDDFGRFDGRPAIIRAKCFPLRVDTITIDHIERMLIALVRAGLIYFYPADGSHYLQLTKWDKHQSRRAVNSKYPNPPAGYNPCKQVISDDITFQQMIANVTVFVFEESIFEESRSAEQVTESEYTSQAFRAYESEIGIISTAQVSEFTEILDELHSRGLLDWWNAALKVAVDNNARKWSYIRKVLKNSLAEGKPPGGYDKAEYKQPTKQKVTVLEPDGTKREIEAML